VAERSSAPHDVSELREDSIRSFHARDESGLPDRGDEPAASPDAEARAHAGGRGSDPGENGGGNPPASSRPVVPLAPTPPPKPSDAQPAAPPELDTAASKGERGRWGAWLVSREAMSCLVSCVLHGSVLLILGLVAVAVGPESSVGSLVAYLSRPAPTDARTDELEWMIEAAEPRPALGEASLFNERRVPDVALDDPFESAGPLGAGFGLEPSQALEWFPPADAPTGGGLEGRNPEARRALAEQGGGTPESEAAVERGLRWLVAYQRADGSWNFDHNKGRTSGFCANPGTVASTTGATAIALAPFLGAGYTHQEGEYQETVRKGLYYLTSRGRVTPHGVDFQEGTMYAQGLAAIALCEAYAMTEDPQLKDAAQGALDFIEYAQHKEGGGWRYTPGEPGDTTVTGWQLMALKSGQMAYLRVHPACLERACEFLDSVSTEYGARYGYMSPQPRKTTTAIGLLMRMYTGWRRSNFGLRFGVQCLNEWGPSKDNMYYNYYATQVLRHWGGAEWEQWNPQIRDYLVAKQSNRGHEAGSWHFSGGHGDTGGRLYNTAMAIMTLEVYYRYMPLYQQKVFGD
jgi:hypothetical protein